jgi:hypothetical protein
MVKLEVVNNNYTKHSISYYIENNDIYIHKLDIDWDDFKTFMLMLTDFCHKVSGDEIKYIRHLVSSDEYNSHKNLFTEFTAVDNTDGTHELMTEPSKFANAFVTGLGFYDVEDKSDGKK